MLFCAAQAPELFGRDQRYARPAALLLARPDAHGLRAGQGRRADGRAVRGGRHALPDPVRRPCLRRAGPGDRPRRRDRGGPEVPAPGRHRSPVCSAASRRSSRPGRRAGPTPPRRSSRSSSSRRSSSRSSPSQTSQDLARALILFSPSDVLDGTNAALFGSIPDSPVVAAVDLPGWASWRLRPSASRIGRSGPALPCGSRMTEPLTCRHSPATLHRPRRPRPALEVDHVSRWYGNVVAVNDISFGLGAGVTGLLGPNGAGKSTLLHLMAGLLAPSAGRVLVEGQTAWRRPEMYRHIGLVPEREAVHAFLTGREFARAQRPAPGCRRSRRRRGPGDRDGRPDRRRGPADRHVLEGDAPAGQARRRARPRAARSCSSTSRSTGWIPRQRLHMMTLLRSMAAEGRTILFSSHILEEVERLADRCSWSMPAGWPRPATSGRSAG